MAGPDLVLASASPRRRELLDQLGARYLCDPADIDESRLPREAPVAYVERMAREKARVVAARYQDGGHSVLAADTIVVVDEDVPAVRVRDLIAQTGAPLVRSVVLFDVYRGEQIGSGQKSLAYRLTYQADDRTLTDRAVSKVRTRIVRRLERETGGKLRG